MLSLWAFTASAVQLVLWKDEKGIFGVALLPATTPYAGISNSLRMTFFPPELLYGDSTSSTVLVSQAAHLGNR